MHRVAKSISTLRHALDQVYQYQAISFFSVQYRKTAGGEPTLKLLCEDRAELQSWRSVKLDSSVFSACLLEAMSVNKDCEPFLYKTS